MLDGSTKVELQDEFDPFAVILLIRWLENNVPLSNRKKRSISAIADTLGVSRHVLTRFLNRDLNRDEEETRARQYAKKLKQVFDQGRPFPKPVLDLYESVYGQTDVHPPGDEAKDKPVQLREVFIQKSMARIPQDPAPLDPLIGLSALVRNANEPMPAPEMGPDASLPGWSVSILNVPPAHVQTGLNHPLFALRQKGKDRAELTVEGIVITQEDRFVFQGIDTQSRRTFNATMTVGEDWGDYRNFDLRRPIVRSGVMLGLSSSRRAFGGLFDLFAIPHTVVAEGASEADKLAFRDRYRAMVENNAGVRDLEGTVEALEALGIKGGAEWLTETLRNMRERSREILLKA